MANAKVPSSSVWCENWWANAWCIKCGDVTCYTRFLSILFYCIVACL